MMKTLRLILLIASIMLTACTVDRAIPRLQLISIVESGEISLPFTPDKICHDKIYKTSYILNRNKNEIHIYSAGKYSNIIGGIGTGKNNFQRLSDITLATDGGIYALDSANRKIRKYDRHGRWITDWGLDSFKRPDKFTADNENNFYIFDFFGRTISFYNLLTEKVEFDFGRFTLSNVSSISINGDNLVVRDKQSNQTMLYSSIGKEIASLEGRYLSDRYGNLIEMEDNYLSIRGIEDKHLFSVQRYNNASIYDHTLFLCTETGYKVADLIYAKK